MANNNNKTLNNNLLVLQLNNSKGNTEKIQIYINGDAWQKLKKPSQDRSIPDKMKSQALFLLNGGPDVHIELEFINVGFCGGRKPGEKPSEQGENQQQPLPT